MHGTHIKMKNCLYLNATRFGLDIFHHQTKKHSPEKAGKNAI